jgi:hypothetical protein
MFICALFAAGCSSGGGGDAFVASPGGGVPVGGGGGNAGAGSVTFNFVKAQAPITVPVSTVQLRFEFFTGLEGTGTIVKREVRDFANTITIDDVPTSVRSNVVTAITAEGFPIAQFTSNVTVPAGGNVTVDAGSGTLVPVTAVAIISSPTSVALGNADNFQLVIQVEFSNGEVIPVDLTGGAVGFTSNMPGVATVDANGLITAGLNGQAFITATLNAPGFGPVAIDIPIGVGDGIQPPPTVVSIDILTPAAALIQLPQGTMSAPIVIQATFSDTSTAIVDTSNGVTILSNNQTGEITVDANQQVVVDSAAPISQTARISVEFMGQTDFFDVEVIAATLQSISAAPASLVLPYGGFTGTIVVSGTFTDGTVAQLAYADPNLSFAPGGFTRFTFDPLTGLVTTNTVDSGPGVETITVSYTGVPDTTVSVDVGNEIVSQLTIVPTPLVMVPGQRQLFTVTATLSPSAVDVDVSTLAALQVAAVQSPPTPPNNIAVSTSTAGAQVVAIAPTGATPAQVSFTLLAAGANGTDLTANVNVTVQAEVIDLAQGITYHFAGIDVLTFGTGGSGLNAVNLPRGYVGVVEVFATFSSGESRRLRANEYQLILGTEGEFDTVPGSNTGAAIKLWQTDNGASPAGDYYTHPTTDPIFTDGARLAADNSLDELYLLPRFVNDLTASGQQGSTYSPGTDGNTVGTAPGTPNDSGVAVTRRTFRAVAADWRRGTRQRAAYAGGAGTEVSDFAPAGFLAPGGSRRVTVRLEANVLPAGTVPMDEDFDFTVTVTDPREVNINEGMTGFVNYPTDGRIPVGVTREFEVRVDFGPVGLDETFPTGTADPASIGPTVSGITGFKLAEANVMLISNVGGANQFAQTAPTDIGFNSVFSNTTTVGANNLNVRAIPIGGDNIRPVIEVPPAIETDDYEYSERVYGAVSDDFTGLETAAFFPSRDQISPPAADFETEPFDIQTQELVELLSTPVEFLTPFLFSVDPPTDPNATVNLILGESQLFRTVVQYNTGEALVDVSQDYPPILFFNSANPAAVARQAVPGTDPGSAAGNIVVSATNTAGGVVSEADVDTQTADTIVGPLVTADNGGATPYAATGLVVAVDSGGFPIPFNGVFGAPGVPANSNDLRGNASNGNSVSGLLVVPPPP